MLGDEEGHVSPRVTREHEINCSERPKWRYNFLKQRKTSAHRFAGAADFGKPVHKMGDVKSNLSALFFICLRSSPQGS